MATESRDEILEVKLDRVVQDLGEIRAEIRQVLVDHEQRLRTLENATAKMGERLTLTNVLQASFAAVVGAVAAVIGRQS